MRKSDKGCVGLGSHKGFSLIELIMAIVIVTAGASITLSSFLTPAQSVRTDIEVETSTQIAQACAEHIINLRQIQTNGWNTVVAGGNNICNGLSTSGEGGTYSRAVVMSAPAAEPSCKAGHTCREFTITVTPPTKQAVTFRLVTTNY